MKRRWKSRPMLRTVFMGSPEFAVPSLELVNKLCRISAVYTQPDKPRGRGNKMVPTPVKAKALELGLPVFEPKKIRDPEVIAQLTEYKPDVIIVVAYAKLIPPVILELPRLGCVNVHPSLLPKYRGAMPVHASLMAGETETGVYTFFMDEGYDTGDLIHHHKTPIESEEAGQELAKRLSVLGAQVLSETIMLLQAGTFTRTPQPKESVGGYSQQFTKEDFYVDWTQSAQQVVNFIRAMAHDPGARSQTGELLLKFGRATVVAAPSTQPGTVLEIVRGKGFQVACGEGAILVEQVKPAGKGWMEAWSFLQGGTLKSGAHFQGRSLAQA